MEVCIGHIVVPRAQADPSSDPSTNRSAEEPAAKKLRLEQLAGHTTNAFGDGDNNNNGCSGSSDVVQVTVLTAESLRDALRRYALQLLENNALENVHNTNSVESERGALMSVRCWLAEDSTLWPVVVPPKAAGLASTWVTWSFCFVPHVLDQPVDAKDDAPLTNKANSQAMGDVRRNAFAAIPLPRSVRISSATDNSPSNCVITVLTERVSLPNAITSADEPSTTAATASNELHATLPSLPLSQTLLAKPLLLVGAGGIGCEVLKVLVLSGFTHIHLIDLDTIDATNLNRQFLFQLTDVGASKAETARRVVLEWFRAGRESEGSREDGTRTAPQVIAYHDNIKAEKFGDAFYRQFAVVLNALDNVSARQHVNRMCMRNNIPLLESGTMGYNGQVQPIVKGLYECYDCRPKPPDTKTFAVCTIHARPTTMVHCVHYAKELYEVLFGSTAEEDAATTDTSDVTLSDAVADVNANEGREGTTTPTTSTTDVGASSLTKQSGASELSYLRTLVTEWRQKQQHQQKINVISETTRRSAAQLGAKLLRQLFIDKVEQLLSLKTSWPTEPPVPLNRKDVDAVVAAHVRKATENLGPLKPLSVDEVLPLLDCVELFERAVEECLARSPGVSFKKDDDSAVRFVSATANLRAHVFHITGQSMEEVRSIAGSIVPAIATTNAIIAAAVVHELQLLLLSMSPPPSVSSGAQDDKVERVKVEPPGQHQQAQNATGAVMPHVVYARKVPQLRRRRLPLWNNGGHYVSPSLYSTASAAAASNTITASPLNSSERGELRSVMDAYLVHSTCPNPPNSLHCLVCQDIHPEVVVQLKLSAVTLGQLVHVVLEDALELERPSVSYGATVLYEDEDYEVLADKTLADLLQSTLLDEETATVQSTKPHRFVLTADALNKEVAWSVVVTDTSSDAANVISTTDVNNADSNGDSPADFAFTLLGVERARTVERKALSRLGEHQRLQPQQEQEAAAATAEKGADADNAKAAEIGRTLLQTVEVIISDNDVSDVEEVNK